MSERVRFIARLEEGEKPAVVAREFGISTKTAYKFWKRWKQQGLDGLRDRSHAVERIPHRTPDEIVTLIVAMRKAHPTWGARKLKRKLDQAHPGVRIPSSATIGQWLTKLGLITPVKRRKRVPPMPTPLSRPTEPNQLWATDFKGQFRVGNGKQCYPLTATDVASRYILACEAFERIDWRSVWSAFEQMFERYGVPAAIRTDNGPPFASSGLGALTRLSVKWLRLGIRHERIKPGHPEQNGQHERMHRTLKAETTRPAASNLIQQQERFDAFVDEFNQERPHEALEMKSPATVYRPSVRIYRGLPELEYPLADDVRQVHCNGMVRLPSGHQCYLNQALNGERVGVREVDDGRWLITFATLDLAYFDERDCSLTAVEANCSERSPISPV
jgi:transposase InsO family protein